MFLQLQTHDIELYHVIVQGNLIFEQKYQSAIDYSITIETTVSFDMHNDVIY